MASAPPPSVPAVAPVAPRRFAVARSVLRFDAFMTVLVKVGGIGVILAVSGIFVFIFWQVLPLFGAASAQPLPTLATQVPNPVVLGADEWSERPFVVGEDGRFAFVDVHTGALTHLTPDWPEDFTIATVRYDQGAQAVAFGGRNGAVVLVKVIYEAVFGLAGDRTIEVKLATEVLAPIVPEGFFIQDLDVHDADGGRWVVVVADPAGGGPAEAWVAVETRRRSLMGRSQLRRELVERLPLPGLGEGAEPVAVLANAPSGRVIVLTKDGNLQYLQREDDAWGLAQSLAVFPNGAGDGARLDFLLGRISVVATAASGWQQVLSTYRDEAKGALQFVATKDFPALPGAADFAVPSLRNRAFLTGSGETVSLRYATTEAIRWQQQLDFAPRQGLIGGKYESLMLADAAGAIHRWTLHDPHPEAGWRAFFGKVWYEGQPAPAWTWQSTGGTQEFEPKLSLVPLIWGSLKGTFYALVFAVPIALLAAIYTSQFLSSDVRKYVKPTMELMASLPSVVLGFLGALWLAPALADRMPAVILTLVAVPTLAVLVGATWGRLPVRVRVRLPAGWEFICFIPILLGTVALCWHLGPAFERVAFVVTDAETGVRVADFRLWWRDLTGNSFEQRNSLVVGFMMGFAVIPLIFTIAEDSLSNVPSSLVSGSLALGASRWQTTWAVVVPMASAGIFSALMIGLGRAVGETMIVVMASGNTPIMELNIFSGMRPLSANIAVELPEAPHGGTLFRALFLGALVLFLLTFVVNTVAEVLRARLREKYRHV